MLIREFTESPNLEDVDLLNDLHFFMNNDPNFYRKVFYPALSTLKKHINSKSQCNDTLFRPCVDQAVRIYCKKFNIPGKETSLFTNVDRDSLAKKIFAQELEHIKQGNTNGDTR